MAEREGRNFLARWSDRKRSVREAEPEAEPVVPEEAELVSAEVEPTVDEEAERNRLAAEEVDLETLGFESDYGVFLKRGVPSLLKRQALKKLWASSPVLANVDGLNDYDENFADPALNIYRSSWEAGRGFLRKLSDEAAGGEEGVASAAPVAAETGSRPDAESASARSSDEEPLPDKTEPQDAERMEAAPVAHPQSTTSLRLSERDLTGVPSKPAIVEPIENAPADAGDRDDDGEADAPVRISLRSRLLG